MTIHPWFISGFVDGEGSFHIAFVKRLDLPGKWAVIPEFHVSQNKERSSVLYEIQQYLGCGIIRENHRARLKDTSLVYVVRNRRDLLDKIIPFFREYPLRSSKSKDFKIFADIVELMACGHHLLPNGLRVIAQKAFRMNGGGKYRKRIIAEIVNLESSETIRQDPLLTDKI